MQKKNTIPVVVWFYLYAVVCRERIRYPGSCIGPEFPYSER